MEPDTSLAAVELTADSGKPVPGCADFWKILVRFNGEEANQLFDELADWEQVLKDTSLARPKPPSP